MKKFLLDTNHLIFYGSLNDKVLVKCEKNVGRLYTSSICVSEIFESIFSYKELKERKNKIKKLHDLLGIFKILPYTQEDTDEYSKIILDLVAIFCNYMISMRYFHRRRSLDLRIFKSPVRKFKYETSKLRL